jgi:hypothetical protein
MFILGDKTAYNPEWKTFSDILHMGVNMASAMIIGGAVLGTALGIPAYYITKRIFQKIQTRSTE